uniref:BIRD-IDD transcription factor fourth C2HC zinc finger domain-containing protein n=1 Tax=Kalanchoe fedtschenkoi TaxID=63787 RepID=A0A7N0TAQ5_KALFE
MTNMKAGNYSQLCLYDRKDSFITHRAFCAAVIDQSSSRFAPSVSATINPLSLRNDFLSGNSVQTHQLSDGGFYPELSSSFHSYGHVNSNNVDGSKSIRHPQWLDHHHHPLNASAHFLMGNPAANLSHELLLQNAGQGNLFGSSSSSSQAPWLMNKSPDQSAFVNDSMSSLAQILGNTSGGGVMRVKREDEILGNDNIVDNMPSLYNPTTINQQQQQGVTSNQSADQFLSSFFGRHNSNSLGFMSSGLSNEQLFTDNNNGFADNSSFSRPPPAIKDSHDTANLNHLMLMHESAAAVFKQEITRPNTKHQEESSQTRDFLGVGGNEMISREEQFQLAASASEQFGSSSSAAELDVSHYNQEWKH